MYGIIHTSDGEVHECLTAQEFVNLRDRYGPEVISADILRTQPSQEQIDAFKYVLDDMGREGSSITKLETEMQQDGTMLLTMVDDGAMQSAYFKRDGHIAGDWIV